MLLSGLTVTGLEAVAWVVAVVAGVALLLSPRARERVRVLDRGRGDLVAVVRQRAHGARDGR